MEKFLGKRMREVFDGEREVTLKLNKKNKLHVTCDGDTGFVWVRTVAINADMSDDYADMMDVVDEQMFDSLTEAENYARELIELNA